MHAAGQPSLNAEDEQALLAEFAASPAVEGALLLGSYARGDARAYSDVDFERFVPDLPASSEERYCLYLRRGRIISVTTTNIAAKRAELAQPEEAIFAVPGLRQARILLDRTGAVAELLAAAHAFRWEPLRPAAERFASEMVLGLAEEVLKLLNGLAAREDAMLSNATQGLLHGITRAVVVSLGLLVPSENVYEALVEQSMGPTSTWTRSHRLVCGLDALPARGGETPAMTRALAALDLYEATAASLEPFLRAEHLEVIAYTRAAAQRVRSAYAVL